jgi:hypothetical protein
MMFFVMCSAFGTMSVQAHNSVVVIPLAGDDAAPGLAGFSGGDQSNTLNTTGDVYRSVTMSFPSSGKAIVNASGMLRSITTVPYQSRCSIVKNSTSLDFSALIDNSVSNTESTVSFAGTRGFNVDPEETTFNLFCDILSGSDVRIRDTNLTVMFFPDP